MRAIMMIWIGFLCLCLCLCPWPAAAGESTSRYTAELAWDQDLIVQRAAVPSVEQPQGEVQLIQRRDLLVVQTLLSSRILKKVAAAIDAKENRNWPETRHGQLESLRYRDELFRATEESWEAFRQRNDRSGDRQTLAIEFIFGPRISLIALSLPQLSVDKGNLLLIDKRPVKIWRSDEDYVRENMFEIVKDSFHLSDMAAEKLLTPLWPGGKRSSARD